MLLCLKRTVREGLCSHGPGVERLPYPSDMPAPEDSGAGGGGGGKHQDSGMLNLENKSKKPNCESH